MKITLIAHKYSLKVKMLYITRHCLIFFCIQGLIRVLIYVTLSPKQTLFQWALYKGLSAIRREGWASDAIHSQFGNYRFPVWEKNVPRQGIIARYSCLG